MSTITTERLAVTGLGPDWSQLEPVSNLYTPPTDAPAEVGPEVIDVAHADTKAHLRAVEDAAFYAERLGSLVARAANPL